MNRQGQTREENSVSGTGRGVVFIGGPSGSGKTALVRALADLGDIYEEHAEANPYIMSYARGSELDAVRNQEWFLEQINAFLDQKTRRVAIVDQHPPGIGQAYTRLFEEEGLIGAADAARLSDAANEIYRRLETGGHKCLTVTLTARPQTLWSRVDSRPKGPRLSREQIARAAVLFQEIVFSGSTVALNSEILGISEEASIVRSWLLNAGLGP